MKRRRAPLQSTALNLRDLEKLKARASSTLRKHWDSFPRRLADHLDRHLEPARVERLVKDAQAGNRAARVILAEALARHLEEKRALPGGARKYLVKVLRDRDPSVLLGRRPGRGRDELREYLRRRAQAAIVAFLWHENGSAEAAYRAAAAMLGYRSEKALRQACDAQVAEMHRRLSDGPGEIARLAYVAWKGCRLLLARQS
jgi:DNA topoisomerase IB